jgi:nicotinamidase/pyrazinamidase
MKDNPIEPGDRDVLVVVDVQNDFCTGSLAIPGSDAIIPVINRLARRFAHVVLTQDWHPPGHVSFASAHAGRQPGDVVTASYGAQKVYRDHCVQGTAGAAFHPGLDLPNTELVLRKGFRRDVDSFSAFVENDKTTTTGLGGYLRARGLERVFVCGLALYGCVKFSALGARAEGFPTWLIDDASAGRPDPVNDPIGARELAEAGVVRLAAAQLGA